MDEGRVQEAIAFLEKEVPREQARVKLCGYGGGPDESRMIANRTGFLRFGVELLKAAYAPIESGSKSEAVRVDISYLLTEDSSIQFDWFERREPHEEPRPPGTRLVPALVVTLAAVVGLLALVGLVTVLQWIAA